MPPSTQEIQPITDHGSVPPSELQVIQPITDHGAVPPSTQGIKPITSHGYPAPNLKSTKPITSHGSTPPSTQGIRPITSHGYPAPNLKSTKPITSHGSAPPSTQGIRPITGHGSVSPSTQQEIKPYTDHGYVPPSIQEIKPITSHGNISPVTQGKTPKSSAVYFPGTNNRGIFPNHAKTIEVNQKPSVEEQKEDKTKIIKTSQRANEALLMNIDENKQKLDKTIDVKEKNKRKFLSKTPSIENLSYLDRKIVKSQANLGIDGAPLEYIQQQALVNTQIREAPKPKNVRNKEKEKSRVGSTIFLFFIFFVSGIIIYIAFNPSALNKTKKLVQPYLIQWGIIDTPSSPVPEKTYPNIRPEIQKFCQEKQFTQARFLLQRTEQQVTTAQQLLEYIQQQEEKQLKMLPLDKGWYNEKLPSSLKRNPTPGEYIYTKDNSIMVYVPEGTYFYGDTKNTNRRQRLQAYYIDKYELTNKQYEQFIQETNAPAPAFWKHQQLNHPAKPVVGITHSQAMQYAKWVGKQLPSEEEWEKAARGGVQIPDWGKTDVYIQTMKNPLEKRIYSWGDEEVNKKYTNYKHTPTSQEKTMYIGSYPLDISPYGCYDMMGNVREWTNTTYEQKTKICKGGDWETPPMDLSIHAKVNYLSESSYNTVGVRFILVP